MLKFSESPPSPPNGDYIGTESCIDLQNDNKFAFDGGNGTSSSDDGKRVEANSNRRSRRINKKERKEFPPPIPLLARTQNLHPHMPWVLKRYYTNDGRLILKEEKVRHHEYFRAHRANGRLTLHLVPLDYDDDVFDTTLPSYLDNHDYLLQQEITSSCETNLSHHTLNTTFVVDQHNNVDHASDSDMENKRALIVVAPNSTPPNPLNCSRVTSDSSCIFGVPVHAIS